MRIITEHDLPLESGCVLSIGNFDGVHIGHAELLKKAAGAAERLGLPSVVWTFGQSPKNVMDSGYKIKYITGSADKMRLLEECGGDAVYFADFNEYRDKTPVEFIENELIKRFNAKLLVCGYDFKFAKNRAGSPDQIKQIMEASGRECDIIPPVKTMNAAVSSTYIRQLISDGRIEEANLLLGRRFSFLLPVIEGRKLGRKIGFPTINQKLPDYQLVPAYGVYACICIIDGIEYKGVSNIGVKPTVTDENKLLCETHILGFDDDLYNKEVRICLVRMIRHEKKFNSLDELKNAVFGDIKAAEEFFSSNL